MAEFNVQGLLPYYEAASDTSSLTAGQWNVNFNKRHAFKVFSDFDPIDPLSECVIPEVPEQSVSIIDSFNDKNADLFRTCIVDDGLGGEGVELCLDDQILTLLLDQSGSMTWNDEPGTRHSISRRMVQRLDATYPGNLNYNFLKFGGVPINVSLFGNIDSQSIDSSDTQAVLAAFFSEDESRFAGVRVVRKTGSFPSHPLDGDIVAEGFLTKIIDEDLIEDTEYFYKIFTFDENFHFSAGVEISATPRTRDIPRGVAATEIGVFNGTGVIRDDNTIGLWHFDEGSDTRVYDFSDSKANLNISQSFPLWLDAADVAIGSAGLRFDGVDDGASTAVAGSAVSFSDQMTIAAWVYPFDTAGAGTIVARQNATDTNYIFSVSVGGFLSFSLDGTTFVTSSSGGIAANAWNHVAVTVDLTGNSYEFFLDGVSIGTGSFGSPVTNDVDDMFVDIAFDRRTTVARFHGRLTEVSIHDTVRSDAYILENAVIDAGESTKPENLTDNGDRVVVIRYEIPSDFNFVGGSVRIVRNSFREPSWEDDGDVISQLDASAGEFFVTDTDDFILGVKYNYRLFSQNISENVSYLSDSPSLEATMDFVVAPEGAPSLIPPIFPVSGASIRAGDDKIYLSWSNPTLEDRFARVEVYQTNSSKGVFPVVSGSSNFEGKLVFSGGINDEDFVHIDDSRSRNSTQAEDERRVLNNRPSFYTIVVRDKYGRVSNPVNLTETPLESANEIGIPLLDVSKPNYEIVNNTSLSIGWDNPIETIANLSGFLDDRVFLFSSLSDEFGRPISDDTDVTMTIDPEFTFVNADGDRLTDFLEVFGESVNPIDIDPDDLFTFAVTREPGGVLRGNLRLTDDIRILSLMETAEFTINIFASIPDPESPLDASGAATENLFEFTSSSVRVSLRNPLEMVVSNRDDRQTRFRCPVVREDCVQPGSLLSDIFNEAGFNTLTGEESAPNESETGKDREFDGAYIRSSNPFVVRVELQYRDGPIPDGSPIQLSSWDITDFRECPTSSNEGLFSSSSSSDFSRISPSTTVIPPNTTVFTVQELVEEIDGKGDPTGELVLRSFVDVPMSVPDSPVVSALYIRGEFNGFKAFGFQSMVMENILVVELQTTVPEKDGIDVAEQYASAYLLDPDSPEDVTKRTLVTDDTSMRWELVPVKFAKDHPFYSTDSVPSSTGGVFSKVLNGIARKVFFGPVAEVPLNLCKSTVMGETTVVNYGESYDVKANIAFDGLTASDRQPLELLPDSDEKDRRDRFLMEIEPNESASATEIGSVNITKFGKDIWADGVDFAKLLIIPDPNDAPPESLFADCFVSCSSTADFEVIPLPPGILVRISAPGMEIIHGDVTEDFDPYTGISELILGANSTVENDTSLIEVTDDMEATFVYFRTNEFLPPTKDGPCCEEEDEDDAEIGTNPCGSCLFPGGGSIGVKLSDDFREITGRTTLLVDEEPRTLFGGGGQVDGVPPTLVRPKEPLEIRVVENRTDNVSSETFVVNGTSTNEVVFELSFAGQPVPDGTPVTLEWGTEISGGLSRLVLDETIIYTETRIEASIDSLNAKSYAIATILPISSDEAIDEKLIATTTFDKSGEVERSINTCVVIAFSTDSIGDFDKLPNVFSKELWAYNTVSDSWSQLTGMDVARSYSTFNIVSEKGYAIGGLTPKAISNVVEEHDFATDAWVTKTTMPTPRFGAMSAVFAGKIYVIGGVTDDPNNPGDFVTSTAVEVYDPGLDEWTSLTSLPNVDDGTVFGSTYAVAFGTAHQISVSGDDRIYVFSGVNTVDPSGIVGRMNDRVLYYDIGTDLWATTDALTGINLDLYKRISPFSFVDSDIAYISGGVDINSKVSPQTIFLHTVAYNFDTSTNTFGVADDDFSTLPKLRYRGGTTSIGTDHYAIGGSDECTHTLKNAEVFDSSTSPFGFTELESSTTGRSAFGIDNATMAFAPFSSDPHIFVSGGFVSGHKEGFLQVGTEFGPKNVRLDGRQSAAISVKLTDSACNPPAYGVRVLARGFLKFPSETAATDSLSAEEQTLLAESQAADGTDKQQQDSVGQVSDRLAIYPVLFESREVLSDANGEAVLTMLPRSDDVLEAGSEIFDRIGIENPSELIASGALGQFEQLAESGIKITAGQLRQPYSILVELTVIDDLGFYFGQTLENIGITFQSNNNDGTQSTSLREDCECVCFNFVTLEGSVGKRGGGGRIGKADVSKLGEQEDTPLELVPEPFSQADSPIIPYFVDIDWIPSITRVLGTSDSTAIEILEAIDNAENEIPFGASALFDALLVASQEMLSDNDLDSIGKVIYAFTDNESNMSFATISETIEAVNAIDGDKEVPTVVGNLAVVFPTTLSARANTTDTADINKIAAETGGQGVTVLSESFENDYVDIFVGESTGALGHGLATFTVDLGSIISLINITSAFELFANTSGTWKIEVSDDQVNFTTIDELFNANEVIQFEGIMARYIRFTIVLVTGFSASSEAIYDLTPLPAPPSLTDITIVFDTFNTNEIFLNKETSIAPVQQIALSANTSRVDPEDIQIGVAPSNSFTWSDYDTASHPSVSRNGRVFIPIRTGEDEEDFQFEFLEKLDQYTFKARLGRWDPASTVEVIGPSDATIADTEYKAYPRKGLVVFNVRREGLHKIKISNGDTFRVAMRVVSRSSGTPLSICGVGYMFNTNVNLLPPAQEIAPEARDVILTPDEPGVYTKIEAGYVFRDLNGDGEDEDALEIRWFINGVRIKYLDDLLVWNDVENQGDPIWRQSFTFGLSEVSENETVVTFARKREESILKSGDKIFFTIRVNDGLLFSEKIKSNIVEIVESPPIAGNVIVRGLKPTGAISNSLTSEDTAIAVFEFTADTPINNSTISWFINDSLAKEGTFGVTENADRILPDEIDSAGNTLMAINNEIFVQVTPETGGASGDSVSSESKIVGNTIPRAENVFVGPSNPSSAQNLVVSFEIVDRDIEIGDPNQENQSTVNWFFSDATTGNQFVEIPELENSSVVVSSFTKRGQQWKAVITPFDGLDQGETVDSNIITIR